MQQEKQQLPTGNASINRKPYYNNGMAIVAVRGRSFGLYLKEGYNIVRRYQKGDAPDDKDDSFEHLGYCKELKDAEKKAEKFSGDIEIREHKLKTDPNCKSQSIKKRKSQSIKKRKSQRRVACKSQKNPTGANGDSTGRTL